MLGWFKNRLASLWHTRAARSTPHAPNNDARQQFEILRQSKQLCEAIDRGAELQLWDHIDRLAEQATRLPWFDAPLADRLARVKIAQGDAETALAMLDRGVNAPGPLRLLRIMCLLHTGARTEAQLELLSWWRETKKNRLPMDGQLLLALLEWHDGNIETATELLREAGETATGEDAHWIQMTRVLIAAVQGQWDRATNRAESLAQAEHGIPEREIAMILDSLRLGRPIDPEQQRHERIEQMTSELPNMAHLIEPLVEAQRRQLDVSTAEELLEALTKAFETMGEHQATAAEGIARLHALLGANVEALLWARRGLVLNPMSARLVLMLQELERDTDTTKQEHAA